MQGHAVPGNCAQVQKLLLVVTINFGSLQASRLVRVVLDALEVAITFPDMSQVLALLRHEQAHALELSLPLPEEFQIKSFCVCSTAQADDSIWHCPQEILILILRFQLHGEEPGPIVLGIMLPER